MPQEQKPLNELLQKDVINQLRAEVETADEQMKLLAAENKHLMNLLVSLDREAIEGALSIAPSRQARQEAQRQITNARNRIYSSMPATNKIIDLIRMEYLAELSRMTCPTSGPVFEKNAQESFAELMIMLKGEDDDA